MLRLLCLALVFWLGVAAAPAPVVLNEIMYHPPDGRDDLQYIELFNRSGAEADLSGWSFTKGIKFTFPAQTKLKAGGFMVVCRDRAKFVKQYGQGGVAIGNFTGKLGHSGEKIELSDAKQAVVDSVKYGDGGEWPKSADGVCASLERICPTDDENGVWNWSCSKLQQFQVPGGTPGRVNDAFQTNLPPHVANFKITPAQPTPGEKVVVTAVISDRTGIKGAVLQHWTAGQGREKPAQALAMKRVSGDAKKGTYEVEIEPQPNWTLSRVRVEATSESGAKRLQPSVEDQVPAYSFFTGSNTNSAAIAFNYIIYSGRREKVSFSYYGRQRPEGEPADPTRGTAAFIYAPTNSHDLVVYDYVRHLQRKGGYKVHFAKGHDFKGMSVVNIIAEGSPRWILSEPLSYELYKMAGVPAETTEHVRSWVNGTFLGYQLLMDQPNQSFLKRHGRESGGNMYKLQWFGDGLVGQHKKTMNKLDGHADLVSVVRALSKTKGEEQWKVIEKEFNVTNFVNYYAVNACIQNWDGYFNNYFLYHDLNGTGKWEIYPWDEDKTWGDYDGASAKYDWYEMPLTYGMTGDPVVRDFARFGQGPFGGVSWWRAPGWFSGPLLANPEFRRRFLLRVKQLCETGFTEEKFVPIINAMEARLEPEIANASRTRGGSVADFKRDIESFRKQVVNRRKFLLAAVEKELKNYPAK